MARIRTIKPKFWDDRKLSKVSRDARLTFIAMWNFADDNGVIIADSIWLKSKIFPYDQIQLSQFEKWLAELAEFGFISLFSFKNEEFYYLLNFLKHQVINRPNLDDVFIAKDALDAALQAFNDESLINHGIKDDVSVPERKGKEEERKGKEGKGNARPLEILFRDSEFIDFEKFKAEFIGTKYEVYNLEFYYESVLNWSNSKNAKKIDWIATARNFMIGDSKTGKAAMAGQNLTQNGNRNSKAGSANIDDYQRKLAERMGYTGGNGQ